jgi:hypothetical protein
MTSHSVSPGNDPDLAGPIARAFAALLPDAYSDDILGDLVEQASRDIAPTRGISAAQRWITLQIVTSFPSMMSLHFRQEDDPQMKHAKWIAAVVIVVMGALQAWDSGILAAPMGIAAMVVVAIGIGVAGLFVQSEGLRFALALVTLVLLFVARLLSPVRLPELGLVGIPVFLLLVLGPRFAALRRPPASGAG